MWIVQLALRRPYTFLVLAIVITLLGVFSILRTPTDIFPNIRIPVVATIWRYTGLSPDEMATRIVLGTERGAQTTVNDVEHTESQNVTGTSVVKYFFQPNVNEELAYAQVTGISQTVLRSAPPPGPQLLTRRRSPTREAHQQFIENFRVLAQNLEDQVREIRKEFDDRIQQRIVKVTSGDIAEALTKRVLTVRTAARGENVDVVIRQASSAEIRAGKLF